MSPREQFSLLLPVYGRDDAALLRESFHSTVSAQTRPPAQVVLVRDGPIPEALRRCVDELAATSAVPVTRVDLTRHRGLGVALDAGLAASDHDIVARMDADDVAVPHRFARQVPLVEAGADLVGSAMLEFEGDPTRVVGLRTALVDEDRIARRARFHDPFNHPTVVYRRSAVLDAGGYGDFPLMEDYRLFARMIANGARSTNLAEPLVYYRVDTGAYARRGGFALLRRELQLQREFRRHRFTNRAQFLRNVLVRCGYRLVPERARRASYRRIIA
ncbi:glycosyltransferase [Saccharopolyspora sp. NPDC050389]|uniref:glycosyltransferase n=1 Tax=unclassified Saccharopolyspora TaxID=2646250 RepID=UPI0033F33366